MSVYIPPRLRQQIREQFANRCAYCNTAESLGIVTFEIEHIIPLFSGGESVPDNLCLACPTCNRFKATHQTGMDPLTQEKVVLFHPQTEIWLKHFAWSEDDSEIIGLTAIGRATVVSLHMNREQIVRMRRMWVKMGEHPPLHP